MYADELGALLGEHVTEMSRLALPRTDRREGHRELALFALAYLTYFGVRALTEGRAPKAFHNAESLIGFERELGIDWEHGTQAVVVGSHVLADIATAIYVFGHWPVLIGAGLLLFRYRRRQYYTLRNACLLTGLVGLVIFALFPVAPPRLTDLPLVDTVTRGSPGYRQLLPASFVNQYAAMPSFHAGWNLLAGIVIFRASTHWLLRAFAVLMPIAMALAVVATANHFVIDVVAGVAIVLAALAVLHARESRRRNAPARTGGGVHAERGRSAARHSVRRRTAGGKAPPAPGRGERHQPHRGLRPSPRRPS